MAAVLSLRVRATRGWTLRLPGLSLFLRIGDHSAQTMMRDIVDGTVCWDQVFDLPVLCQEFCGAYELDSPLIIDGYTRQGSEPIFHSNHKLPRLLTDKLKAVSYPLHGPVFLELDLVLRPATPEALSRRRNGAAQRPLPLRLSRPTLPEPISPSCSRSTTPRSTLSKGRTGSPPCSLRPSTPTSRSLRGAATTTIPVSRPHPPRLVAQGMGSPSSGRTAAGGQGPRKQHLPRTISPAAARTKRRHCSPSATLAEAASVVVPTASDGEVAIAPMTPPARGDTPSPELSPSSSLVPPNDHVPSPRSPAPLSASAAPTSPGKSLNRRSYSPRCHEADGFASHAPLALESTTILFDSGVGMAQTEEDARQLIQSIRGLSTTEQQDLRFYILGLDADASSPEALKWAEAFIASMQSMCDYCHQSYVWMNLIGLLLERGHREFLDLHQSLAGMAAHESRLELLQQGLCRLEENSLRAEEMARLEMERLHEKHRADLQATIAHWEGVVAAEADKHRSLMEQHTALSRPSSERVPTADVECQTEETTLPPDSDRTGERGGPPVDGAEVELVALRQRVEELEQQLQHAEAGREALEAALQAVVIAAQDGEEAARNRIRTLEERLQQQQQQQCIPPKCDNPATCPVALGILDATCAAPSIPPWRENLQPDSPLNPHSPPTVPAPADPEILSPLVASCTVSQRCGLPECTCCRAPSPNAGLPPQQSIVL